MIVETEDGSKTLYSNDFGEHYHSMFGAENESNHVFIHAGYDAMNVDPISVLEIGFGTGLNAFLTMQQASTRQRTTYYESIELYPVDLQTAKSISDDKSFLSLHTTPWEEPIAVSPYFILHKRQADLTITTFIKQFNVVYFDAFSPAAQPEMWSRQVFTKIYTAMYPNAVLTTYCAKGEVRRTMHDVGLIVERLPGPKGKREILRGSKIM